MIKYYGSFADIMFLEAELTSVNNQIDAMYDFWNENSVPESLVSRAEALSQELETLKRTRTRGGLVCSCY